MKAKVYVVQVIDILECVLSNELECFSKKKDAENFYKEKVDFYKKQWHENVDDFTEEEDENNYTIYKNGYASENATYVSFYEKELDFNCVTIQLNKIL